MSPIGMIICPKCNDDMTIRVGRSWLNKVFFYCKCDEIIEI